MKYTHYGVDILPDFTEGAETKIESIARFDLHLINTENLTRANSHKLNHTVIINMSRSNQVGQHSAKRGFELFHELHGGNDP